MNNNNTGNLAKEIPVFRLDGGELHYLAKHRLKLEFSTLSPFKGQPEGGVELSAEAALLLSDSDFKKAVQVLAQPQLKIALRRGGPASPFGSFTLLARHEKSRPLVFLEKSGDGLILSYFENGEKFGEYFAARFASFPPLKPVNVIKTEHHPEFALFVLALADCYRRAYLHNMLAYSTEPVEGIYEDEFVAILERELKSSDLRWLVPSLFMLVESLKERKWEFSGKEVDLAEAMGFISRVALTENKRPLFLWGGNGKYWGLEFSLYWRDAMGLEVWTEDVSRGCVQKGCSYYLAFTGEANHVLEFKEKGSEMEVRHKALTGEETAGEIGEIIIKHLEGLPPIMADKKGGTSVFKNKQVCDKCGSQILKNATFCTNCGTKLN